jgi:hypothetical protein
MPALVSFEYAIVRVVPRVEREEFINVGVIVHCHERDYLEARIELDEARLLALARDLDTALLRDHLDAMRAICSGEGPIGELPLRERWHWLTAPRSTIVQTSQAHAGVCESPEDWPERLLERVVRTRKTGA